MLLKVIQDCNIFFDQKDEREMFNWIIHTSVIVEMISIVKYIRRIGKPTKEVRRRFSTNFDKEFYEVNLVLFKYFAASGNIFTYHIMEGVPSITQGDIIRRLCQASRRWLYLISCNVSIFKEIAALLQIATAFGNSISALLFFSRKEDVLTQPISHPL